MFTYRITYWLADDSLRKTESLEDYGKYLDEAKEHYNDVGGRARNKKRIISYKFNKGSEIEIMLESTVALATPTLALQVFSRYLVNETPMRNLVKHKALFRGTFEEIRQESNDSLSDADMLKHLVEVILDGSKQDKELVDNVKRLIIESAKWRTRGSG